MYKMYKCIWKDETKTFYVSNMFSITETLNKDVDCVLQCCTESTEDLDVPVYYFDIEDGCVPSDKDIVKLKEIILKHNSIVAYCHAGLGRSPLMIGICLILVYGLDSLDVIECLRSHIKGCLNRKQIDFLEAFNHKKPSEKLKKRLFSIFKWK